MGKLTKNQKLAAEKIEAGKAYSLKEAIGESVFLLFHSVFVCEDKCRYLFGF